MATFWVRMVIRSAPGHCAVVEAVMIRRLLVAAFCVLALGTVTTATASAAPLSCIYKCSPVLTVPGIPNCC
jgi:hypothetical protein